MKNEENIKAKFLSKELSARLAVLGFDEECLAFYDFSEGELFIFYSNLPVDPQIAEKTTVKAESINNTNLPDWGVAAPLLQDAEEWLFDRFGLFPENFMDDDGTFGFLISKPYNQDGVTGRINYPIVREIKSSRESRIRCISTMIEIAISENTNEDQDKPVTEIMKRLNLLDSERPVDSEVQNDELHRIISEEAKRKSETKIK